jgi:hypothetical protein
MDRTTDHDEHATNISSGMTSSKRNLAKRNMMELIECMPTANNHQQCMVQGREVCCLEEEERLTHADGNAIAATGAIKQPKICERFVIHLQKTRNHTSITSFWSKKSGFGSHKRKELNMFEVSLTNITFFH